MMILNKLSELSGILWPQPKLDLPYDARAIANYFINLANGSPLTPMKIGKLVYYAHGWHLAITGRPLIKENIEAWEWGPVVPSVYWAFEQYGLGKIQAKAACNGVAFAIPSQTSKDQTAKEIISKTWDVFGKYTGVQLANMTHDKGSPWGVIHESYHQSMFRSFQEQIIPDDELMMYFISQAKDSNNGNRLQL